MKSNSSCSSKFESTASNAVESIENEEQDEIAKSEFQTLEIRIRRRTFDLEEREKIFVTQLDDNKRDRDTDS